MKGNLKRWPAAALACLAFFAAGMRDRPSEDALRVGHLLRAIAAAPPGTGGAARSAEISETQLNAYIAHRLAEARPSLVRQLTVDLLVDNHIKGRIQFDARALKLASLLGERLDFDFKGIVHTRRGAGRLQLIALELCGQRVNPQVFDFVVHTASLIYHQEPSGIEDWYELPRGIERVVIGRARAVLHY